MDRRLSASLIHPQTHTHTRARTHTHTMSQSKILLTYHSNKFKLTHLRVPLPPRDHRLRWIVVPGPQLRLLLIYFVNRNVLKLILYG